MAQLRVPKSPAKSRFATVNSTEFQQLIQARDAASTQRSTEVGVRLFKQYLTERSYDPNFASYTKVLLADGLEMFYVEVAGRTVWIIKQDPSFKYEQQ